MAQPLLLQACSCVRLLPVICAKARRWLPRDLTGGRAIRFDMLERLEDELEQALPAGTDAETLLTKLVSLLGSSKEEARAVLAALGWRSIEVAGAKPVWRRAREKPRRPDSPRKPEPPPNSPFAGLAALRIR